MPTVDSAMTLPVITITPDETVTAAARMMSDGGVSGLPVVDPDGRVIGIITEADFLDRARAPDRVRLDDETVERPQQSATVAEVMSHDVVGICPDAPLSAAAQLMEREHVKRLVVFGPGFELKGVISRSDVIAALGRPDPNITQESHNNDRHPFETPARPLPPRQRQTGTQTSRALHDMDPDSRV